MKKNKINISHDQNQGEQGEEGIKKSRQKEKRKSAGKSADEIFQEYQKILQTVKSLGGKKYSEIKREDFIKRNNFQHNANFLFIQEERQDVFEIPGTPYATLIWVNRDVQLFQKKVLRLFIINKRDRVVCKAHIDYSESEKQMQVLIANLQKTLEEILHKAQCLQECPLCGSNDQKYFMFIKKKKQEIFLVCTHIIAHDGGREMKIPFKKGFSRITKEMLVLA